jgi:hypothetical protein
MFSMPIDTPQLATALRSALARVAEPERAAPMQAYAKSDLPFLGVTAVPLRRACPLSKREALKNAGPGTRARRTGGAGSS